MVHGKHGKHGKEDWEQDDHASSMAGLGVLVDKKLDSITHVGV